MRDVPSFCYRGVCGMVEHTHRLCAHCKTCILAILFYEKQIERSNVREHTVVFFTNPNNVSAVMGDEKKQQEHQRLIDKYRNEIPKFQTKQFNIELLGK